MSYAKYSGLGGGGAGSGTVTSVSVVTANGFSGTVANPTTAPAITLMTTITGILQGNGTAISAATTGNLTSTSTTNLVVTGGTGAVLGSGALLTLTGASLVEATSSVLTITGATNAVLGTGVSIQVKQSSGTQSGYLSSADWNTFNGKQPAGSYLTSVSVASSNGLAGSSSGGTTPTLTLSTSITGILQGNGTAISAATTTGSGSVVLSTSPTLVTPALGTPSALVGTNITGTAAGLIAGNVTTNANLTGPVTSTGNATAVTNNAITNAMLAQAATLTLKGNNTGGTANVADLTVAQVLAMLFPPGLIEAYGASSAPTGWLNCDGSAVSRTIFAALFSIIGTTYGSGNGTTTFNIPDLRGIFARGIGTNGALSYSAGGSVVGPSLGSYQNDQAQGHIHQQNVPSSATGGSLVSAATSVLTGSGVFASGNFTTIPTTDGTNGTPRTGTETRPFSVGVNYIIKT